MAAEGGRIDFMFLGPPLTQSLDPLLVLITFIRGRLQTRDNHQVLSTGEGPCSHLPFFLSGTFDLFNVTCVEMYLTHF